MSSAYFCKAEHNFENQYCTDCGAYVSFSGQQARIYPAVIQEEQKIA